MWLIKNSFFLVFILITSKGFTQKEPGNINEIISYLSRKIPRDIKEDIQYCHSFDSILFTISSRMDDAYPIRMWLDSEDSLQKHAVEKYFNRLGIYDESHIEIIILTAFRDHLNKITYNFDQLINEYQAIENRRAKEEKVRFVTDTLEGEYIPRDLEDAFRTIDSWWSDSIKKEVKSWSEDTFLGNTHHGFGTGLRNGWGLWAGSRLSKYFNDIGIHHPDDMSGIILTSYYRYLLGKEINLSEQVNYYKQFWLITKEPSLENYPKGVTKIEFNGGFHYEGPKYGRGFLQIGLIPDTKEIWLYDYHFGWKKFSLSEYQSLQKIGKALDEETVIKLFGKD